MGHARRGICAFRSGADDVTQDTHPGRHESGAARRRQRPIVGAAFVVRSMGKVMALLKSRLAGRADMADVSRRVRSRLAS